MAFQPSGALFDFRKGQMPENDGDNCRRPEEEKNAGDQAANRFSAGGRFHLSEQRRGSSGRSDWRRRLPRIHRRAGDTSGLADAALRAEFCSVGNGLAAIRAECHFTSSSPAF